MKIGIVGNGIVGGSLRRWLEKKTLHDCLIYDPPQGHISDDAFKQDVIFVAVPVPTKEMKQDLSLLHEVIPKCAEDSLIFVRSSVLPGTCDELGQKYGRLVMAMPEFLTERSCDDDMAKNEVIVGYPEMKPHMKQVIYATLADVFDFKKKLSLKPNRACEMAKFTHNVFGAVKVTFFNMIADLCQKKGIKYQDVLDLISHTGYINEQHTAVPGPDGRKGFGGRCFPVNLEAMIGFAGADSSHLFLKDIHCLNRIYRGLNKEDLGAWREGQA